MSESPIYDLQPTPTSPVAPTEPELPVAPAEFEPPVATAQRELPVPPLARKPERLLSLDVVRGLTIAGMILVNNPGSSPQYIPLEHAEWNGWTPTDLIFPSFLFIVGVAMTFSLDRRLAQVHSKLSLLGQVVRRTLILFMLGLIMYGFGNWRLVGPYILGIFGVSCLFWDDPVLAWSDRTAVRTRKVLGAALLVGAMVYFALDFAYFNEKHPPASTNFPLRIPGVLQRIAVCYFFASLIAMFFRTRGRVVWVVALLAGYYLLTRFVHAPADFPVLKNHPEATLHQWLDVRLLGAHLYSERPEPEGILSTMPAIATTLLGVLTGGWLRTNREGRDKAIGLFFWANLLIFFGLWAAHEMPINKKIWTSSYVLLAGGISMNLLAMCYWLIDVKGRRRWAWPFMVFGTNAILVFFASGIVGRLLNFCKLPFNAEGHLAQPMGQTARLWLHQCFSWPGFPADSPPGAKWISVRSFLYQHGFASPFQHLSDAGGWLSWLGNTRNASLAWALAYVLFWLILLIPLYRKRIFLKV
jgi:predicted acyltransferase